MNNILTIENLRLGYGNEEVMRIDDLKLKAHTITGLLGPSGGGKSSLVKTILIQTPSPSYWKKGNIYLNNKLVDSKLANDLIGYVSQKARLYTNTLLANFIDGLAFKQDVSTEMKRKFSEKIFKSLGLWHEFENILDDMAIKHSMGIHKILLIVKAMIVKPKLLLLDEILANTSIKDEAIIIDLIKKLKKFTTILIITHNKDEAKTICDSIALVSGGILHEHTSCDQFFTLPTSEIGKEFIESGSAWYSNHDNNNKPMEDNLTALRRFSSMCDFFWILSGQLGGMQKPGLMTELKDDLTIMNQLGVKVLVSLQLKPIDVKQLNQYDIDGIHFPIKDMGIPNVENVYQFLSRLKPLIEKNSSIVYHCKAGMGRTGTMLACHLLWQQNISAIKAIESIRQVNYKYIQTSNQMEFVSQFEHYIQDKKLH